MKGALPLLRFAGLALPLLTAGCMSGVLPGSDAPDPSCVLLCALTHEMTGEPPPQPVAPAAEPAPKPSAARVRVTVQAKHRRRAVARAHLRPAHRKLAPQVSVVPQAPAQAPAATPAAMVPSAPAPVAVAPRPAPAEPARSLSQAIPGSVGIVAPNWQGQ